jgi:hypothetical protein
MRVSHSLDCACHAADRRGCLRPGAVLDVDGRRSESGRCSVKSQAAELVALQPTECEMQSVGSGEGRSANAHSSNCRWDTDDGRSSRGWTSRRARRLRKQALPSALSARPETISAPSPIAQRSSRRGPPRRSCRAQLTSRVRRRARQTSKSRSFTQSDCASTPLAGRQATHSLSQ